MADFRLETDRLVLRDWREDDLSAFIRHTNTPAVMRWLGGVQDESFYRATYDRIVQCRMDYGHCFWLVERKEGNHPFAGEILGFCGLKRSNVEGAIIEGEFEIGWRIRADAQGQGFAREAAEAALAAGFEQFAAPHINAITVVQNRASWGLMERIGMVRNPALDYRDDRFGEELADVIAWSITREQWQAQTA